jgi:hypothetical protein
MEDENMVFRSCENEPFEISEMEDRDKFRHCGYCGSLDPVELAELIKEGKATMHGADWKYGYPHKFYVDIVNPTPDKLVDKGGRSWVEDGVRKEERYIEPWGPVIHAKFYTNHFGLLDDEIFEKVAETISCACGIAFFKREGKLMYSSPQMNYQKD